MYIVNRRVNESIAVGDVIIQLVSVHNGGARIGIVVDKKVVIKRVPKITKLARKFGEPDAEVEWVDSELDRAEREVD